MKNKKDPIVTNVPASSETNIEILKKAENQDDIGHVLTLPVANPIEPSCTIHDFPHLIETPKTLYKHELATGYGFNEDQIGSK